LLGCSLDSVSCDDSVKGITHIKDGALSLGQEQSRKRKTGRLEMSNSSPGTRMWWNLKSLGAVALVVLVANVHSQALGSELPKNPIGFLTATIKVGNEPATPVFSGDGRRIFVSASRSNQLSIIAVPSGKVLKRVKVGSFPVQPALAGSQGLLYVPNRVSNSVSLINQFSGNLEGTISVGYGPTTPVYDAERKRMYVANWGTGNEGRDASLSVIDTISNTLIRNVPLPSRALQVLVHPAKPKLYVVSNLNAGIITVINANSLEAIGDITVGAYPYKATLSSNGSRLFVPNYVSNSVSTINTETDSLESTLPTNIGPLQPILSKDESQLFVPNYFSKPLSRSVTVIDVAGDQPPRQIRVAPRPGDSATGKLGKRLFVPSTKQGAISVVSESDLRTIGQITLPAIPGTPVIDRGGRWLYVAHPGSDTVSFVDLTRAPARVQPAPARRLAPIPELVKPSHLVTAPMRPMQPIT
jgi:YVTN family beta-propeller protein